jgi:hypothetical protein
MMDDGNEEEFGPDDIGYVPPGHTAWVVEDEPFVAVDSTAAENYAKSISLDRQVINEVLYNFYCR